MRPQSAKSKGRRFQQWVRDKLLVWAPHLTENDIRSTSMGASGQDILLSEKAIEEYPIALECKNQEKLNIWDAYKQACDNKTEKQLPVVAFKKNNHEPMVAMSFEDFLTLWKGTNESKKQSE